LYYERYHFGIVALSGVGLVGFIIVMMYDTTIINMPFLIMMKGFSIPIFALSRSIQIIKNYRAKSTGQLSLATATASASGPIIRIFTTLKETGDVLSLLGFILAAVLSLAILGQILYYKPQIDKKKQ
jgi:mannose-P-dolichol utilization defect protein 1